MSPKLVRTQNWQWGTPGDNWKELDLFNLPAFNAGMLSEFTKQRAQANTSYLKVSDVF